MKRGTKVVELNCNKYMKWVTLEDAEDRIVGAAWQYFDKNLGEKGEKVNMELPFKFFIIDDNNVTFKGYNEATKEGIYSNEGRDKDHTIAIRNKAGILREFKLGDYKKNGNKEFIKSVGAKYTKSVYIAFRNEAGELELANLQIGGAAFSGAVDQEANNPEDRYDGYLVFTKQNKMKVLTHEVVVSEYKLKRKGKNKFSIPVFSIGGPINQEDSNRLDEMQGELENYLEFYFDRPKNEDNQTDTEEVPKDEDSFVS